jgi:hypothetical protein
MIVTLVINTRKDIDFDKLREKIYKEFGNEESVAICSPYPFLSIEGNAPIKEVHRLYCAMRFADVVIYISTIYSDASPINKMVRAIELNSGNVYNWLVNQINCT